jgi:vacuolar protein sorting-associated protein VTA1
VIDDVAGKAYVEQFGLETFQRADNAVRANKTSRQTADTFQASATFLDLLQIWGQIEPEIVAKSKYAKYHALRIAKAIKAGDDPNLSNPKTEPEEADLPQLDANDPDVQMLNGGNSLQRQPSVVEVPDETDRIQRHLAQRSHLDESLHPSRAPSLPREGEARQPSIEHVADEAHHLQSSLAPQSTLDQSLHPSRTHTPPPPQSGIYDVSPLRQPTEPIDPVSEVTAISPISAEDSSERKPSTGGNYFPAVSPAFSYPAEESNTFAVRSPPSEPFLPEPPTIFHHIRDAHSMPPAPTPTRASPPPPQRHHGNFLPPPQPIPPALASQSQSRQQIPPAPRQIHQQSFQPPVEIDEQAIMKAQKHARFAISALNFEDVPTAVKELRGALMTLGAL